MHRCLSKSRSSRREESKERREAAREVVDMVDGRWKQAAMWERQTWNEKGPERRVEGKRKEVDWCWRVPTVVD